MTKLKIRFMIIVLEFIQLNTIQSDHFGNKLLSEANDLRQELKMKLKSEGFNNEKKADI